MKCDFIDFEAHLSAGDKLRLFVSSIISIIAASATVAIVMVAICGCVYKGAKVTEGTDLAVGLNIPGSEGAIQIQALNYLSGFRLGVDKNAVLRVKYTTSETNSYLGCVSTSVSKTVDATVEPCVSSDESVAVSPNAPGG